MMRSISAEWLKMRRSKMTLILAALPVVSVLIGSANYYLNQEALQNDWLSLWTQVSLFYGEFFLPILIAICCAYACRLEHMNQNWKMIMAAPISAAHLYLAKLLITGMMILFAQAMFLGLYWLAGTLLFLPSPFPVKTAGWVMRGWAASLSIIALQLELSLRFRSFVVPIGINLCAVFIGLGMYINKLGLFFPFSLLTIGMSVLSQDKLAAMENLLFWLMSIAFVVIFASISICRLKNNDIVQA